MLNEEHEIMQPTPVEDEEHNTGTPQSHTTSAVAPHTSTLVQSDKLDALIPASLQTFMAVLALRFKGYRGLGGDATIPEKVAHAVGHALGVHAIGSLYNSIQTASDHGEALMTAASQLKSDPQAAIGTLINHSATLVKNPQVKVALSTIGRLISTETSETPMSATKLANTVMSTIAQHALSNSKVPSDSPIHQMVADPENAQQTLATYAAQHIPAEHTTQIAQHAEVYAAANMGGTAMNRGVSVGQVNQFHFIAATMPPGSNAADIHQAFVDYMNTGQLPPHVSAMYPTLAAKIQSGQDPQDDPTFQHLGATYGKFQARDGIAVKDPATFASELGSAEHVKSQVRASLPPAGQRVFDAIDQFSQGNRDISTLTQHMSSTVATHPVVKQMIDAASTGTTPSLTKMAAPLLQQAGQELATTHPFAATMVNHMATAMSSDTPNTASLHSIVQAQLTTTPSRMGAAFLGNTLPEASTVNSTPINTVNSSEPTNATNSVTDNVSSTVGLTSTSE